MNRTFIVLYTGLMVGLGPVCIDSFAPVQGMIRDNLELTQEQALLGMTYLIFSMGFFQVLVGPLSDRFGRKPIMLLGLVSFIAGSVVCFLAGNLSVLLAGRVLQGLGGATGQIVGRAILRDLHSGPDLAHINASSIGVMAAAVFISPLLSQQLAAVFSWHVPFAALAVFGLVLLALTVLRYEETLAEKNPEALKVSQVKAAALALACHPQSRIFLLVLILGAVGMFSYVVSAQHIYATEYGITGIRFAFLYSFIGIGVLIGQVLNRHLIHKIGTLATIAWGLLFSLLATLSGVLLSAAGILGGVGFAAVIFAFAMGTMMCAANSMALVMDPHGQIAGFASSMIGFLTFSIGATAGTALAWVNEGDATATLAGMLAVLVVMLALALDWLWRARHRHAAVAD